MNIDELAAAQAEEVDLSQEIQGGGFERELPVAGLCVCRFREYIEAGVQPLASKAYPDKKPASVARYVFELTGPKHKVELEDKDGNKSSFNHTISTPWMMVSQSAKSGYFKLFKQLNHEGTAKVPAQLLGKAFLVELIHAYDPVDIEGGKPKKDAKPKYCNFKKDDAFTFRPPRKEDPLAGTSEPIKVPELTEVRKLFLWNHPTQECWDSLFIDGTRTKKVDGKDEEVSKNWLQNKITEALNFDGSPLQKMLLGGDSLDNLPTEEPVPEEAEQPKDDMADILGV